MFDQLFDYEIPFLHPIAVHFPLGLLLIAGIVACIWMFSGSRMWRHTTLVLVFFGATGSVFAFLTGEALEEDAEGVPIVDQFVELHEKLGRLTMIVALVSLVALGYHVYKRRLVTDEANESKWPRFAIGLLIVVSAILVAVTGHIGGTMVWGVPVP